MTATVLLDFLSDPMGGLLASARAFLDRVSRIDAESRLVVLEVNHAVSAGVADPSAFEWVNVARPSGLTGWRRILWQNTVLPRVARRHHADVYLSLSHYLPRTLPSGVRCIVGVSNLAPFSSDAYAAETDWRSRLRLRLLRRSILSACRRADRVVALSGACREELVSRGIEAAKVSIVRNGVAVPGPGALPAQGSGTADFVLCVSHFYRYKNYERLVRAYAALAEPLRARYRLLLIGAPYDGTYLASVRRLIAALRLEDRVQVIPGLYGDELARLYRECAAFVFPSLVENSPLTLLEAMTHGAAIAASDISGMRELGGDAVLYFDPHSERQIAGTLARLLEDEAERRRLGDRAVRRARCFTWDDFTASLVHLYREVLA